MPDHNYFANLIWQIADLLRGPYRPPQYERVMLPMTVLRRFDCVLMPTKAKVLAERERRKGGRLNDDALEDAASRLGLHRQYVGSTPVANPTTRHRGLPGPGDRAAGWAGGGDRAHHRPAQGAPRRPSSPRR